MEIRCPKCKPDIDNDQAALRIFNKLSRPERRVSGLLLEGLRNKEIADRMGKTEQVVKNYLRGIFDKTGTHDRLSLALLIIHHPLLSARVSEELNAYR